MLLVLEDMMIGISDDVVVVAELYWMWKRIKAFDGYLRKDVVDCQSGMYDDDYLLPSFHSTLN